LDVENPQYKILHFTLRFLAKEKGLVCEKKGRNLVEVVKDYLDEKHLFPLIDTKLQVVFGIGGSAHGLLRIELYRYHAKKHVEVYQAEDGWFYEGMGYYFTSMPASGDILTSRRQRIIAAPNYRQDRFDKDLFMLYEVEHAA
jgi:hypothetical protein